MKTLKRKINYTISLLLSALLIIWLFTVSSSFSYGGYLFTSPATTSDTTKLEYYLELKGNVRQSKSTDEKEEIKPIDSSLISIYSKDVLFSEVYTNKKGRCVFKLPLDKKFKIIVSKPGFITKFFEVATNVPSDKKNTFSFSFDIDLFEAVNGLDVTVLQKPIAKVTYNVILEQFAYDISYTSRINFELKKMYKNYYVLQKKINNDTLSKNSPLTDPKK